MAPRLYDGSEIKPAAEATAAATTRAGILVVCAATVAAVGAALALIETRRANREADQRERYAKAIDHIGSTGDDRVDVRLGGIYLLQRVAEDSVRDLPTVVEVLCAFVRVHGRRPEGDSGKEREDGARPVSPGVYPLGAKKDPDSAPERHRPPPDVQAALNVIGRVHSDREYVDLEGAHLEYADLSFRNLSGANLFRAHLIGANLTGADLSGSLLIAADLTDAHLRQANLRNANSSGADLSGAQLHGAELTGRWAAALDQDQLARAGGDKTTRLPKQLARPTHWGDADNVRVPVSRRRRKGRSHQGGAGAE